MIDQSKFIDRWPGQPVPFDCLLGDTFSRVWQDGGAICLVSENGCTFGLGDIHGDVTIEDICGDLELLIGSEILLAHEDHTASTDSDGYDREAWHFYRLGTAKGYVTVRFYGCDGYYADEAPLWWVSDPLGVHDRLNYEVEEGAIHYRPATRLFPTSTLEQAGERLTLSLQYQREESLAQLALLNKEEELMKQRRAEIIGLVNEQSVQLHSLKSITHDGITQGQVA